MECPGLREQTVQAIRYLCYETHKAEASASRGLLALQPAGSLWVTIDVATCTLSCDGGWLEINERHRY